MPDVDAPPPPSAAPAALSLILAHGRVGHLRGGAEGVARHTLVVLGHAQHGLARVAAAVRRVAGVGGVLVLGAPGREGLSCGQDRAGALGHGLATGPSAPVAGDIGTARFFDALAPLGAGPARARVRHTRHTSMPDCSAQEAQADGEGTGHTRRSRLLALLLGGWHGRRSHVPTTRWTAQWAVRGALCAYEVAVSFRSKLGSLSQPWLGAPRMGQKTPPGCP